MVIKALPWLKFHTIFMSFSNPLHSFLSFQKVMKVSLCTLALVFTLATPIVLSCEPNEYECHSGECIPDWWACDFYDDCGGDNSDEWPKHPNCTCEEFRCADGEQCVKSDWACDYFHDCDDRSDEYPGNPECSCDHQCGGGEGCIPSDWICDDFNDCSDGSDEKDCPCPNEDDIRCPLTPEFCLKPEYWCDCKVKDCPKGEDEENCDNCNGTTADVAYRVPNVKPHKIIDPVQVMRENKVLRNRLNKQTKQFYQN